MWEFSTRDDEIFLREKIEMEKCNYSKVLSVDGFEDIDFIIKRL